MRSNSTNFKYYIWGLSIIFVHHICSIIHLKCFQNVFTHLNNGMGNNIHQKGDSRSCGRWDDSWVGYMISCSAERYVNVPKGASEHLYQKLPENTMEYMFHGTPWCDWQSLEYGLTGWVIDGDLITLPPSLSAQFPATETTHIYERSLWIIDDNHTRCKT